jgi:plasmid stabilization system protein ParE
MQINWTLEALNDFEFYIDWYIKEAGVDVASNFIDVIDEIIGNIKANKYIARMVDDIPELREYIVQQFPYLVSYWVKDESQIIITSFLHQKRKK